MWSKTARILASPYVVPGKKWITEEDPAALMILDKSKRVYSKNAVSLEKTPIVRILLHGVS